MNNVDVNKTNLPLLKLLLRMPNTNTEMWNGFYKRKRHNDLVINSLTLKVRPGLHVFLTLRLLWPERCLILRYANVTDVGERSVWHCKLNPLSQLWYGSAFQRGLLGGGGSLCRAGKHTLAVSHMQWTGWNLKHAAALSNVCSVLVKPDEPASHLSLQLRLCCSHRCCRMLFSYLNAVRNKCCRVELQWSREPSHFLRISGRVLHMMHRSTGRKIPIRFLLGFYEICTDQEQMSAQLATNIWPREIFNISWDHEQTAKSPATTAVTNLSPQLRCSGKHWTHQLC